MNTDQNVSQNIHKTLIDLEDSMLILIDIQDSFLDKYDNAKTQSLLAKVIWLLRVSKVLKIPVVAMGEDLEITGNLNQSVRDALPDETVIYNKNAFCLTDNVEILAAVNAVGRRTAVVVGMETDVCVSQSALGLVGQGYQVVVLKDAVATTEVDEEFGLSRMRQAGVVISSVKSLYYEWVRSVSNCRKIKEIAPELGEALRPSSLVL